VKTGFAFQKVYFLFPVLLSVALATSCGGGTGNPSQSSIKASLTLTASSLDFGGVSVGASKTSTVTISNPAGAGGESVAVSQVTITGAGFTASTSPVAPFTLGVGQSATLSVTFAPKASGTVNGTLTISVAQASSPTTIPVTGDGLAQGQLAVTPSTMNFGSVTVGSSSHLTGTLTAGSSDIAVSSAGWNGLGYSVSGITFPTTVAAGKSISFTVTFAPQSSGTSNGNVSFVSNASNSPTVATLTGVGSQAAQHSVTLSWNASTSSVVGYYIYRSTQSGSYSNPLNSTPQSGLTFTDSTVQSGTTYYYVVTSVDSSSQQSIHSNEVQAIVP
jgi:hypothetical protein